MRSDSEGLLTPGSLSTVDVLSPSAVDTSLAMSYCEKPTGYFSRPRMEIAAALPSRAERVAELGCGDGATLSWLRSLVGARYLAGIELMPEQAAVARSRPEIDSVIVGDIEQLVDDELPGNLDLVLCLDVLEHLRDPWAVIKRLSHRLRTGGCLIASLPNLRHVSAMLPLVIGDFRYVDSGVRDRTHLRFFTRRTAIGLVSSAGLKVDFVSSAAAYRGRLQWLRRLVLPLGLGFLDRQYVIRGIK